MIKLTSIIALQIFFFTANTGSLSEPLGWGHSRSFLSWEY